jgi:hypothetical protein
LGNGINEQGLKEYKAEREVEATTDELDYAATECEEQLTRLQSCVRNLKNVF